MGSELALASFGFSSSNNEALGIRARRVAAGSDWASTAIGIGMDVDNTVRAGNALWLAATGNVGIGTPTPAAKLDVEGGIRTTLTGSTVQTLQDDPGGFCGGGCAPNTIVHNLNIQGPQMIIVMNGDWNANPTQVVGLKTYDANSFTIQATGGTPGNLVRWNWIIFQQ